MTILDPTSILFKNVTPYCSRFGEIQFHFSHRLQTLEDVVVTVTDHFAAMDSEPEDETLQDEIRRRLLEAAGHSSSSGNTSNVVGAIFGLPAFRLEQN